MNSDSNRPVLATIEAGIGTIILNRPEKLNSFNKAMHEELRAALDRIEHSLQGTDAVRAVVITGTGRAFCTGQDLSERQRGAQDPPPDLAASLRDNYNPLISRIAQLPVPVIAAVNGVAAGSGANLALACDIVIAARSAYFVQSFCRVGLVPDAGGTWILPRLIGMARSKALTFLGEKLSADQAAQWGMIWQVVADEVLMETAMTLAAHLAAQPTRSFELQKQAFAASLSNSLPEQLELEATLQGEAGQTADYREGITSFFEKRPAIFRGA